MSKEELLKAKRDLELGLGGGNTTQVCIWALEEMIAIMNQIEEWKEQSDDYNK